MEGTMSEIRLFGGTFAPRGWAYCAGQQLSISTYTALYALIGTIYGGDGVQSFQLPNMQGRHAVMPGQAAGSNHNYQLAEMSGAESTTLTSANLPTHVHALTGGITNLSIVQNGFNDSGSTPNPIGAYPSIPDPSDMVYATSAADAAMAPYAVSPGGGMVGAVAGGSQPINLVTALLAVPYIICIEGIFPVRN